MHVVNIVPKHDFVNQLILYDCHSESSNCNCFEITIASVVMTIFWKLSSGAFRNNVVIKTKSEHNKAFTDLIKNHVRHCCIEIQTSWRVA